MKKISLLLLLPFLSCSLYNSKHIKKINNLEKQNIYVLKDSIKIDFYKEGILDLSQEIREDVNFQELDR